MPSPFQGAKHGRPATRALAGSTRRGRLRARCSRRALPCILRRTCLHGLKFWWWARSLPDAAGERMALVQAWTPSRCVPQVNRLRALASTGQRVSSAANETAVSTPARAVAVAEALVSVRRAAGPVPRPRAESELAQVVSAVARRPSQVPAAARGSRAELEQAPECRPRVVGCRYLARRHCPPVTAW